MYRNTDTNEFITVVIDDGTETEYLLEDVVTHSHGRHVSNKETKKTNLLIELQTLIILTISR